MSQEAAGEEGPLAVLDPVAAGASIEALSFLCVDQAGRPAAVGAAGKVQVSWTRGSKKVKLRDSPMPLPAVAVSVGAEGITCEVVGME